jgi:hypothetical protein
MIASARDGFIYRTRKETSEAAQALLATADPVTPLLRTAQHNWLAGLEEQLAKDRPITPDTPYLGEAFLASAAWRTLQALSLLGPSLPRLCLPIWGLNHQFGLLELAVDK